MLDNIKIEIQNYNIKNILKNLSGSIKKNNDKNILSYIMIKISENKVIGTSINEQIEIIALEKLIIKTNNGTIIIKYDFLNNLCKTNKEKSIISFIKKKNIIEIKAENSFFTTPFINEKEFPSFENELESISNIIIKTDNLKNLLLHTTHIVSENNLKLFLNGILFSINKNNLYTISSDGFRLIFSYALVKKLNNSIKFIIPKTTANEIIKTLKNGTYTKILIFDNQVKFVTENLIITSKLINDIYYNPDININAQNYKRLTIKNNIMKNALEKIRNFCINNEKITLSLSDKFLIIKIKNNYDYAKVNIKTECKNIKFNIGVNYKYLVDIIKLIKSNNIEFIITEDENVIIIKEELSNYIYILMTFNL